MATIERRKRKDGKLSYRVTVRMRGYPRQTATFRRLRDAQRWEADVESKMRDRQYFPADEARRHTLEDVIQRYSETVLPNKARNTILTQRPQLDWWNKRLGHVTLSDLSPDVLTEARDELASKLSAVTANQYRLILRHALAIAVSPWRWLQANPMNEVKPLSAKSEITRYLSDDERERLLKACQNSKNPYLHTVVVLAVSTGARKMELLTLKWSQVDLTRGRIKLVHTKSGKRRMLHLFDYALSVMREHAKVRRLVNDLVFPGKRAGSHTTIQSGWYQALAEADVHEFRFHDLRHTFASYLAANGATLHEISELLGHANISTTQRYAHLAESTKADRVREMNERIFG